MMRASTLPARASGELRQHAKRALVSASGLVWRSALSRDESIARLRGSVVFEEHHPPVVLPALPASAGPVPASFRGQRSDFQPDYVWRVQRPEQPAGELGLTRSGTPLLGRRSLLDLDFGAAAGLLERPTPRRRIDIPLVVAPWSHRWGGYYDFVIFVLAKLCRIEAALGPIWNEGVVAYPLLGTAFERAFLGLLGISEERVIDTWSARSALRARTLVLGNNQDYYWPSPSDLRRLRERFPVSPDGSGRRLYIPRRDTRQVRNEEDVLAVVRDHGFEVFEPSGHPVEEQLGAFAAAEAVVGPHGAGLANILWCRPGTRVVEFMSGDYTPVPYYYLSRVGGLRYSYLVDGPDHDHWSSTSRDMTVDARALDRRLAELLGQP